MHNREITHIVKTDSLSKKTIICKDQKINVIFAAIWEKLMSKLKKEKKSGYETKMQKLDLRL